MDQVEFAYNADDFVVFSFYARWKKVPKGKIRSFHPTVFWLTGLVGMVGVLLNRR